jgi:hypothetical protein
LRRPIETAAVTEKCQLTPKSPAWQIGIPELGLTVNQHSFFFGGVWFGCIWEAFGRGIGIGERGRTGEWGGIGHRVSPLVEVVLEAKLLFHVGEGREHDLAHIGEGHGFAKGDTVLGDGGEELSHHMVDIGGGEEIAMKRGGNFVAEALGLEELKFLPGMEGTEGGMGRAAQHAAAAAVGKMKLAACGDTSTGIRIRHGNLLEVDFELKPKGKRSGSADWWKNPKKADPSLRSG